MNLMQKIYELTFIYIITTFLIININSCSFNKNAMQTSNNNCNIKTAEKTALEHFGKHNKEGYKFRVNKIEQDDLYYFVEILLDEDIKEKIEGKDTLITMVVGGGAKYTIDKKTCKIAKVEGYE